MVNTRTWFIPSITGTRFLGKNTDKLYFPVNFQILTLIKAPQKRKSQWRLWTCTVYLEEHWIQLITFHSLRDFCIFLLQNLSSKFTEAEDDPTNNQLLEGRKDNTSIQVKTASQRYSVKTGNTRVGICVSQYVVSTNTQDSLPFCLNSIKALKIHWMVPPLYECNN